MFIIEPSLINGGFMKRSNRNKVDEPRVHTRDEQFDANVYKHPSYGSIRVSRMVGQFDDLFATETIHNSAMRIEIGYAQQTINHGNNFIFDKETVVSAEMSPIQFSEMITNPNSAGVPCTLRYTEKLGNITYKPSCSLVEDSVTKVEESLDNITSKIDPVKRRASEILEKKGTITKADRQEIQKLINSLGRELTDSVPFYTECVKENLEKMQSESCWG